MSTVAVTTRSNGIAPKKTFADLVAQADVAEGNDLAKDKAALVGVPFLIHTVTFRDGVSQKEGKGVRKTNYVSIECIVADKATMDARKRKGLLKDDCPFEPEERIVFNDGSTGVARQITAYLHAKGLIVVKDNIDESVSLNGGMGESVFDTYRADWVTPRYVAEVIDGGAYPDLTFDVAYLCPRGLQASKYANDFSDEAYTYYIA